LYNLKAACAAGREAATVAGLYTKATQQGQAALVHATRSFSVSIRTGIDSFTALLGLVQRGKVLFVRQWLRIGFKSNL
jgi:hypothetical protein